MMQAQKRAERGRASASDACARGGGGASGDAFDESKHGAFVTHRLGRQRRRCSAMMQRNPPPAPVKGGQQRMRAIGAHTSRSLPAASSAAPARARSAASSAVASLRRSSSVCAARLSVSSCVSESGGATGRALWSRAPKRSAL